MPRNRRLPNNAGQSYGEAVRQWRGAVCSSGRLLVALSLLLACACAGQTEARKGWVLQAGAGVGISRKDTDWGLALPNLTLGRYVRRNLVVAAHGAATSHLPHLFGAHPYDFVLIFYGPMVQWWPHQRFYLAAASGLATYVQDTPLPLQGYADNTTGMGAALKASYTAAIGEGYRINVAVEALPAFFNFDVQVGLLAAVEWELN